jgi:hypothetical protein
MTAHEPATTTWNLVYTDMEPNLDTATKMAEDVKILNSLVFELPNPA